MSLHLRQAQKLGEILTRRFGAGVVSAEDILVEVAARAEVWRLFLLMLRLCWQSRSARTRELWQVRWRKSLAVRKGLTRLRRRDLGL